MKRSFGLSLLLIVLSFSNAFADVVLTEEKCSQLAVKLSIVEFSPDTSGNLIIYKEFGLNNETGVNFIDKSRDELDRELIKYCKTASPSIEELANQQHKYCSQICQNNAELIYKKPMFGPNSKKLNADTACLMMCNRGRAKIEAIIEGINIGRSVASQDCNGTVSNNKRDYKPTILDGALETERSFYDTKKK